MAGTRLLLPGRGAGVLVIVLVLAGAASRSWPTVATCGATSCDSQHWDALVADLVLSFLECHEVDLHRLDPRYRRQATAASAALLAAGDSSTFLAADGSRSAARQPVRPVLRWSTAGDARGRRPRLLFQEWTPERRAGRRARCPTAAFAPARRGAASN